jgi:hypothetical protein
MMKTSNFKLQTSEKLQVSTSKHFPAAQAGVWILVLLWILNFGFWSFAAPAPLYSNNFEKAEVDKVPEDMLVLDGDFKVKEDGGKFLELPGAPLDTFGVLFGPATNSNVAVTARIFGTGKGRRYPVFGIGLNGAGGYKLKIAPSKNQLELYKGDDVVGSSPFKWKSDTWTNFKLQVRSAEAGQWVVEGKAWETSGKEPEKWDVTFNEKTEPSPGRAMVTGSPYSGTPIRFDDFVIVPVTSR